MADRSTDAETFRSPTDDADISEIEGEGCANPATAAQEQEVTDVTAETKKGANILVWLAWISALTAIGAALWWGNQFVRSSPVFFVQSLEIRGNQKLSVTELRVLAGLQAQVSIFEVEPEQVQRRLLTHPWIVDAQVERRLPDTIVIQVKERTALGIVSLQQMYLFDADGSVFKKLSKDDPWNLPVLTMENQKEYLQDPSYRAATMLHVIRLLRSYDTVGLGQSDPVSEIHVQNSGDLELYVGRDSVRVLISRQNNQLAYLKRLRSVLRKCQHSGLHPKVVFINGQKAAERIVVRLAETI